MFNVTLLIFGIITLIFGDWRDAVFLAILILNAGIGILQEARAKRSLDRLAALVAPRATVVRDGRPMEVAIAADVRKTFAARWQIGAVLEGAARSPDDSLGLHRALGPRGLARLMGILFVGDVTFGAFVDLAAEGNVEYGGRTSPSSSQRVFALGTSVSLKTDIGLRTGLAVNWVPPIDGFSSNAVAATGITTFLAYTR